MEKRKILIISPFRDTDIERIKKSVSADFEIKHFVNELTNDELKKEITDAEIIVGQPPLELIADVNNCPRLKFLQITWAGTDMYTAGTITFPKNRIILANSSGVYGIIMSQYAIGMILSIMLRFKEYHNQQQKKVWERRGPVQSLDHAKVLVFGAGDIGTSVAKRLSGFDAYCIGVCRNTAKKRNYFKELCTLSEAEKYISDSDVIIGCLPNTSETKGYFNLQRLSLMKKTAVIINVGRGNFIDCMALDKLLREDKILGAALDVTNPEPLPPNHPLWDNPRCMITPHTSGATFGHLEKTESALTDLICENLRRYSNNEELINRVL